MDSHSSQPDNYEDDDLPAPLRITRHQYLTDRSGKTHGTANPSLMDKPFWKYMIAKDVNAYHARTRFDTNGSISWGDTIWCFERAGATLTQLPDGREVRIGGEHEDFYDPDFCIYNDVVVFATPAASSSARSPTVNDYVDESIFKSHPKVTAPEDITIYGYPVDVFPPTDFHTSTYVFDSESDKEFILIIGGLGYHDSALRDQTDVYRLDLSDFSIHRLETSGAKPPGGTQRHTAALIHDAHDPEPRIKITTEEGQGYSLLVKRLEWISHGHSPTWAQVATQELAGS